MRQIDNIAKQTAKITRKNETFQIVCETSTVNIASYRKQKESHEVDRLGNRRMTE